MQISKLSDAEFESALASATLADLEKWEREITLEIENRSAEVARLSLKKTSLEAQREQMSKA
jgi:chromosome segregation ATPase